MAEQNERKYCERCQLNVDLPCEDSESERTCNSKRSTMGRSNEAPAEAG